MLRSIGKNPSAWILGCLAALILAFVSLTLSVRAFHVSRRIPSFFFSPPFDPKLWMQADPKLREGYRVGIVEVLLQNDLPVGLPEEDVLRILGKPDNLIVFSNGERYMTWKCDEGCFLHVVTLSGVLKSTGTDRF